MGPPRLTGYTNSGDTIPDCPHPAPAIGVQIRRAPARRRPGSEAELDIVSPKCTVDTCFNAGTPILCYRPTWSRDGLGRQTDYLYNNLGQLTEQTDPADAGGVRRKTYVAYETGALSRRSVLRVCGATTTCGSSNETRTEHIYWASTFLPLTEIKIDQARGITLTTTYAYDPAGRLLSTDGPLPGTGDAGYNRYDDFGRKTWEIGPAGVNGVRTARKLTYRNSDDKVIAVELGTVTDPANPVLRADDAAQPVRRSSGLDRRGGGLRRRQIRHQRL
jgi:YD repeat-containing protein